MRAAIKKPISDINSAFEAFKSVEAQSWRESGLSTPPPPEFLVKPSGSLCSQISHRLNQPSFTTNIPENGETADQTNGCIAMVMGTAFEETTLIYDQVHRRDHTSDGSTRYPPFVRQAHQEWTSQISESSEAKVEVVYGLKTVRAIMTDQNFETTPLPLWGEYSGIILILLHETNFQNAQQEYKFRRIMVFAYHPQRLLNDHINGRYVVHQDKALALAAAMTGVRYLPNYYKNKLWLTVQPPSGQRHLEAILGKQRAQALAIGLAKSVHFDTISNTDDSDQEFENDGNWEQFFKENPHSNKKLYELLPAALSEATQDSQDWHDPLSFPKFVREWWEGQKQILFYESPVSGLTDVLLVLDKCQELIPGRMISANRSSLRHALTILMEIQKQTLERNNSHQSPKAGLVHSRFDGCPFLVKCGQCGTKGGTVKKPVFSVNRPNHYVVISRRVCQNCGNRTCLVPIHGPHTAYETLYSTAPKIEQRARYSMMLQLRETLTAERAKPVESFCLRCREQTKVKGGGNVNVDSEPLWTLGGCRPLYVERRSNCLNCQMLGRDSGRFVPKDEGIPSIFHKVLARLADLYGRYDGPIIATLMDHWPPSSRTYRGNATVEAYSSPAFVSPSGSNTVLELPSTSYQGAPIRRSPNKDRSTSLESFQVEAEGAPTEWRSSFSTGQETSKESQSFHQATNSIVAADEDLMPLTKKRD